VNPDVTPLNCEQIERRRSALRRVGFYGPGIFIPVGVPKTWGHSGQTSTTRIGAVLGYFDPLRFLGSLMAFNLNVHKFVCVKLCFFVSIHDRPTSSSIA
jgi:hypothetical protein